MKRKDGVDVSDDFSDSSVASPAKNIRQREMPAVEGFGQSGVGAPVIEEVPVNDVSVSLNPDIISSCKSCRSLEIQLLFSPDSPPLSVIAAAKVAAIAVSPDPTLPSAASPVFIFSNGSKLCGTNVLLRYLGQNASLPGFYGDGALESSQIDEWLDYAANFSSGSEFERACKHLNQFMLDRTFLVGQNMSIADVAIWAGLAGSGPRWESLIESMKYQNVVRWFHSVFAEYSTVLNEVVTTYAGTRGSGKVPSAANLKEREQKGSNHGLETANSDINDKRKAESRTSFGFDLPDAIFGKVCLRFAPEPRRFLLIGHSKAALLNQYFAHRYDGHLILRLDDTTEESKKFKANLMKDVDTLGIKYDTVTYTSAYLPKLTEMAKNLILAGKAYVDDTPWEQMQKERMDGIESKCRRNSKKENLRLWDEMLMGLESVSQCCLRGKLDMQDPNKSLQDPVYFRCNPRLRLAHQNLDNIYPTYDFACPFLDAEEGITHALRSSEYHDDNGQYHRIQEDMGLRKVHIYEVSQLNMVNTLLSTQELLWFEKNRLLNAWNDPRFPTVQGIVRRGLKIEALLQFILEQGASKNLNLVEWDKLWTINKKIIDPVCPRFSAVLDFSYVVLTLSNGPGEGIQPRHQKCKGAGENLIHYTNKVLIRYADVEVISEGEEITLMDLGNVVITGINKDDRIIKFSGLLNHEGSSKTTRLKLPWITFAGQHPLKLVEFDCLLTKKKMDEGEEFLNVLDPCTTILTFDALGERCMGQLKRGDIVKLDGFGYFRCDSTFGFGIHTLFAIPDGRQPTTSLRFQCKTWLPDKISKFLGF